MVPARLLRLIHRRVGAAQELAHVSAVSRIEAHSDARSGNQRTPVDQHGRCKRLGDPGRGLIHLARIANVLQHHDEFIPAHAHHEVLRADRRLNALGDRPQELVSGLMPPRIIDILEPIEVEKEHGQRRPLVSRGLDRTGQVRGQKLAIGEPGERVVMRKMIEALLILEESRFHLAAQGQIVEGVGEDGASVELDAIAARFHAHERAVL